MTSTTDSATRTHKRRRTPGSRAIGRNNATAITTAAATQSTAPNDPHRILGTRLEPIMEVLALQPTSLQTHIIAKTNAMLDLLATIKQRDSSHSRFSQPMTNARTGNVLIDEAGQPIKFVPNSCRDKCPIKPSQQSNDDNEMKTLLEAANKDHDAWKQSMAAHARNVSELELNLRNAQLRKLFYEFVKDLSLTKIVTYEIIHGGFPASTALTKNELAHVAAHTIMNAFSLANAAFIGFGNDIDGRMETANSKLARDYAEVMSFDVATTKNKAQVESDGVIVIKVVEELSSVVPTLTTGLWRTIQDQERQRAIKAAIKLALVPPAKKRATDEVEDHLALLDAANPTKSLLDLIDKRTKAGIEKLKQEMKRDLRKNYLADSRDQESTPTANGRKSRKASTVVTSSKKKKGAAATQPTKAIPKGKTKPKRRRRPKAGQDSAGEPSGEGQRKDAGRR